MAGEDDAAPHQQVKASLFIAGASKEQLVALLLALQARRQYDSAVQMLALKKEAAVEAQAVGSAPPKTSTPALPVPGIHVKKKARRVLISILLMLSCFACTGGLWL